MSVQRDIFYICDKNLIKATSNVPHLRNRSVYVHYLLQAYGLLDKCNLLSSEEATEEDLYTFHSSDYLQLLKKAEQTEDLEILEQNEPTDDFNLCYDCPLFKNIYNFTKIISGGTLTAAKKLTYKRKRIQSLVGQCKIEKPKSYLKYRVENKRDNGDIFDFKSIDESHKVLKTPPSVKFLKIMKEEPENCSRVDNSVVINWQGGWHHAQRDAAEGFCYVNDIVIAILHLLKYFRRIMYIDLDVHHGNGVENAFSSSNRVLTMSIHKREPGYYPCSGDIDDVGIGSGLYHTVNVPLRDGASDDTFIYVFEQIFNKIISKFPADCVVVQCGADCLAGDPLGGFNLTHEGLGKCLKKVLDLNLPTIVLGGGGYNEMNVARCWTYLTSLILGVDISLDIPDSFQYFHLCGPDFQLEISPSLRKDSNTEDYVNAIIKQIHNNLDKLNVLC